MCDFFKERIKNSLIFKISNIYWYIAFFVGALVMIGISQYFDNNEILKILENICYSVLAATVMAFFIDYNNLKRNEKEKIRFRENYFSEINHYFSLIIGHLLWFEKNINDESINWDLEPQSFLFAISSNESQDAQKVSEISFDDARSKLENLQENLLPINLKDIPQNESEKWNKIFRVLFFELNLLLTKFHRVNEDKLILDIKDYFDLNDINQLLDNISLCVFMLEKNQYSNAIFLLNSSFITVRQFGNYENNICVSVKETVVNIAEL